MKRIPLIILFTLSMISVYGQAVVSAPALEASSIANGIQLVMQVENTISSIENQIKQIEQAKQQLENHVEMMKSLEKPESLRDAISQVNAQITFIRNMEAKVKSANVTIGSTQVPLTEMYKVNQVMDVFIDDTRKVIEADYTESERAYIYSHIGLDPSNFLWLKQKQRKVSELGATMALLYEKNREEYELQQQALQDLQLEAEASGSAQEIAQANFEVNKIMAGNLADIKILLGVLGDSMAMMNTEIQTDPSPDKILVGASNDFIRDILLGED